MSKPVTIGIDLGGTHLRAALVASSGAILHQSRTVTPRTGLQPLLARLQEMIADLQAQAGRSGDALQGVGIGVPATLSGARVVVCPNLPFLKGVDLGSRLPAFPELPVRLYNDADAAAWGEYRLGAGRELTSFLMLTLGTGVGGALVLDGRLWRGADAMAGEVGHVMVEPQGPPCGCGSRGCLEQYASARAILASARRLHTQGHPTDLPSDVFEDLDGAQLAGAAAAGDPLAREAYRLAGCRLGQVIAGVAVNLLNLDGVVIGGGASAALEWMLPALREELALRAFAPQRDTLKILAAQLGDDAGVLGAALLAGRS